MGRNKRVIVGPKIEILEPIGRFEIVKRVVEAFIEFEKDKKGKEVGFRYSVEKLSTGDFLYIHRPGRKWNFDFKVIIPDNSGLGEGTHEQIALLLRNIKISNSYEFEKLWNIIKNLYYCKNNNVDMMLKKIKLPRKLNTIPVDILLKVIKWLFIMEDIIYWHYEGRIFLFNFLKYAICEEDENRLKEVLEKGRQNKIKPENIKKLLKILNKEWEVC